MNNDCLITRLKGTVDSSDLMKIGEIHLTCINALDPTRLTCVNENYMPIDSSVNDKIWIIYDKYAAYKISDGSQSLVYNLKEFKYFNNLHEISLASNQEYTGSLFDFPQSLLSLQFCLYVSNSDKENISYNIGNHFINLKCHNAAYIRYNLIIEDLVRGFVNAGRTTDSCNIVFANNTRENYGVYFKNNRISTTNTPIDPDNLSWSTSGNTITIIYEGDTETITKS